MSRSSSTPEAEIDGGDGSVRLLGEATLLFYGLAGRAIEPFAGIFLARRERQGKEDATRLSERFGKSGRARPDGPLVWVHATSVGEAAAALPVIERLIGRGMPVLLTTSTVSAAQFAARRLPAAAIHQFIPIDTPAAVRRFLEHWRPKIAIFTESEFWPTTVKALARQALPLIVINARMSERSFRSWRRFAPLANSVIRRIDLLLAQSPGDAERLRALGARRVSVCGNLKFDVPPPPADGRAVEQFRRQIAGRPVFVAASTQPGEVEAILSAHAAVKAAEVPLLTILAPRQPRRGAALAGEVSARGMSVRRRSLGEDIEAATDIYVADTIGEMGLWYRLADVAFLGGSIVPRGGQNPIEPAKLGVPVLHGEHVGNFRDIYDALADAGAVECAGDGAELAAALKGLIEDAGERRRRADAALLCIESFTGALACTLKALDPYVSALAERA